MTTVTIDLNDSDALGFGATWARNIACALFQLGVTGSVGTSPAGKGVIAVTADVNAATIERADRAAKLALTRELEDPRQSYHRLIDEALQQPA